MQSAEHDQIAVQKLIAKWQDSYPNDKFLFRPSSSGEDNIDSLLFLCQTEFQRGLLQRYDSEMVSMDATCNFTNYDMPMYNLCIPTNVGYYVVASFIISKDRTPYIIEGLRCIKEWNPQRKPKHFIVDFDLREIEAIEQTFPGVKVFLCDFHRSQAWQRWLTKNKIANKNEDLALLSKVAKAENEEMLLEAMARVSNCVTNRKALPSGIVGKRSG